MEGSVEQLPASRSCRRLQEGPLEQLKTCAKPANTEGKCTRPVVRSAAVLGQAYLFGAGKLLKELSTQSAARNDDVQFLSFYAIGHSMPR